MHVECYIRDIRHHPAKLPDQGEAMKALILSLALAAGAVTQAHAQTLPDLGGLPGGGSAPDAGLLLDLLNSGFDQFAGEDGMLPAGEGVAQLTGLGDQLRMLVINPLNDALPEPLLLPLLSDLSIVLSDLNNGGTPSLPGLPDGGDVGELPELPGAGDLPDALGDLLGQAGGAEQLLMLLESLSGGGLDDPAAIADLLDPAALQSMLEELIGQSGGLAPPAELTDLLDAMALQSALEDLIGQAGGAEQLQGLLEGLPGGVLPEA